ncbi:hypothetical protein AB0J38_41905 [Streptomyces sp. NPDC050095]|uniref:hypothetical protein n=1 Tax=unclassified Streptomyces TaxID=2593676 RepID=UPI00343D7302
MPRKSSSAALLLTAAAAVGAVTGTGCVSVHTPAAPAVSSPSAGAPHPRPDGHADRPLVQGPAREALERTGPSPRSASSASSTPSAPSVARSRAAQPPAPREAVPPRRAAQHSEPRTAAPRRAPSVAPEVPAQTDVCALGRQYGGWDPDSPQAVICRGAYGS